MSVNAYDMSGTAVVSQPLMWPYFSSALAGLFHRACVAVLKSASVRTSVAAPRLAMLTALPPKGREQSIRAAAAKQQRYVDMLTPGWCVCMDKYPLPYPRMWPVCW